MNKFLSSLFLFIGFLIIVQDAKAQLRPPLKNFSSVDYNGETQNWDISQDSSNLIYVANSKGLLEYNGANWKLYSTPNESIMRSVKVVGDRIYSGCYMEFGYWKKNELGGLNYYSISKESKTDLVEDEEFWNIIELDDVFIFQSKKRIYLYNVKQEKVEVIDSSTTITNTIKVDQTIYFQKKGQGIFKIEYGKNVVVSSDSILKNDDVINIFSHGGGLLVLTQSNGFLHLIDNKLIKWNESKEINLSDFTFYSGIRTRKGQFVLGTISNGIIYLDENGQFLTQISQTNGLKNNTVLSVFEDLQNNIWLGLDDGVCFINTDSPFKVYNDNQGVLGSVYASAIKDGILYLGTNQGLFYKSLDQGFEDFELVQGTNGQVWDLKEINGELFCAHHLGSFIVRGLSVEKIADVPGTWKIAKLDIQSENLLIQGNYDGLYILEKQQNNWQIRNKIEGFNNSSRYFETLSHMIFVNHEYNGVFNLQVDSLFHKVKVYTKDKALRGANSGMTKFDDKILYSYSDGVYVYDEKEKKFYKDSVFSGLYTKQHYESGKLIYDKTDNMLWAFTKPNINVLEYDALTNLPEIRKIPLVKNARNGILGYENLLNLGNGTFLMGTTSGYITVDLKKVQNQKFSVEISNILVGESGQQRTPISMQDDRSFSYNRRNIELNYYSPVFNSLLPTKYQFQLKGLYDSWSNWSGEHSVSFENLPYGEYEFKVRSIIGQDISSNIAGYNFKILKPWYFSNLMIVIYTLGVVLFSFFMHTAYNRYYKKQQLSLVEKNKRELAFAKIKSEKEIIRIKNEKLEAEFKGKSKELAASTMSIIKKNELLTKIKEELNSIHDRNSLKPVIEIIDKNLNKNDDWELFKEAFNNTDSKFFKKIKKKHPKLSPSDLKLCAYLRLNLSSKEIAQLFNISPRSVEIKRYRLRKKLNLQHEDNLVNYILKL